MDMCKFPSRKTLHTTALYKGTCATLVVCDGSFFNCEEHMGQFTYGRKEEV